MRTMKQVTIVVCALLATSTAFITPRDLIDEATKQLEELKATVQGQILAAHSELEEIDQDFQTYGVNTADAALITIQQEKETIDAQLQTVKDLAHSAGKDITSCTNIREDVLNRLPSTYAEQIIKQIGGLIKEVGALLSEARYIVDISINKVHDLEHQLANCKGEILCISPLITEIQLNKIRLPQNIKTEVQAAESLVTTLKVSVNDAGEQNVAQYTSEASAILGDITACVNRIIG
ncbi:uncharacterized protein LOC103312155 isoform X2 [Tribolium castaneum]|uniref:Protein TsetseEP domain-containing protein n=1 Tax=Tribolium castaneum TaxID=7070 RepID=D6WBB9_TRICA|nr:PREDICTED: uncharacterized protein LOC662037 [Tribolium castaneum]EEZ97906.1 hypothetical protein TcasGA2_TC000291 [Tribolium castaneum]|eukprot:XP_976406.1 PREDICTED: uncharacterized protein LOC662037 [Tribolium castaneum]